MMLITKPTKRNNLILNIILVFSGLLTGLAVSYPAIGIIEWVSLSLAFCVLIKLYQNRELKLRAVYRKGFLLSLGYYVAIYSFFVSLYPLSFTGMSKTDAIFVIALAWFGLSLFHSLLDAFMTVLVYLFMRSSFVSERLKKIFLPILTASLWAVFEWLKTLTWLAFPWGRLSLGQVGFLPFVQSASLFGSYFVTFLIVAVNILIAEAIVFKRIRSFAGVTAASIFAFNAVFGVVYMTPSLISQNETSITEAKNNTVTFSTIQPNIDSGEKWSGILTVTLERVDKYVAQAVENGAKIIIMPETVMPIYLLDEPTYYRHMTNLAKDNNVTLFVGAFELKDSKTYNSIIEIRPDGSRNDITYSKRHLVPFGEYLPARDLLLSIIPPLGEMSMFKEELFPGRSASIYKTEYGNIGALICFDSVFEDLALDSVRNGAELIIIPTNDSWFLDSTAVYMHNRQAQLRAIECGRYIVRSGNTGISSVIDDNGQVLTSLPPLVEGQVTNDAEFLSYRTLYSIIGNTFVYILAAFSLTLVASSVISDIIKKHKGRAIHD